MDVTGLENAYLKKHFPCSVTFFSKDFIERFQLIYFLYSSVCNFDQIFYKPKWIGCGARQIQHHIHGRKSEPLR